MIDVFIIIINIILSIIIIHRKGRLIQITFDLVSLFIIFDLNRRTNNWVKRNCPNQRMSCIGKYRRNLINMRETLWYFYFEKSLYLMELCNVEMSSYFEMSASNVFWLYNTLYLIQSVGRIGFNFLIIRTIRTAQQHPAENKRLGGFYVSQPKLLEPRRPMATATKMDTRRPSTTSTLTRIPCEEARNCLWERKTTWRKPQLTTITVFHDIASVEGLPSIVC